MIIDEESLYHYTSHETLFHIVETGTVWASNAYYMNDRNEVKYAIDILSKIIFYHIHENNSKLKNHFLSTFNEWVEDLLISPFNVFCFSLSEHGNLLSQWRAYTPHGTGVSIGFGNEGLKQFSRKNKLLFFKCCYAPKKQEKLMKNIFDKVIADFDCKYAEVKKEKINFNELQDFLEKYKPLIIQEAIKIKDPAFSEESEWRLVKILDPINPEENIYYKPSKTTLVPYIKLNLKEFRNDESYFSHIYVGPSPNFGLSFHAIADYVSQNNACYQVINAQQPYREI